MNPSITTVSASQAHGFSKQNQSSIRLLAGLGVMGDAHMGEKVQHLSRVAQNPDQPNLRQVHLLHQELFDELKPQGFEIMPGQLGENICTQGIDLLALPTGTRLHLGKVAVVELTGLRNPCHQIEKFRTGLLAQVVGKNETGNVVRKAGVMAIVLVAGNVQAGDKIKIELPALPHKTLERV